MMTEPTLIQSVSAGEEPLSQHRPRSRWGSGGTRFAVNLTSLIDVTFLLLIYFMVATDFRLSEEIYRLDLPAPESSGAGGADPFSLDKTPLRIQIATDPGNAKACSIHVDGPFDQPASFDDLYSLLRRSQHRSGEAEGMFEPDHPIIIEPSRQTRWEHAVEALNAAARARYTNVTFAPASAS